MRAKLHDSLLYHVHYNSIKPGSLRLQPVPTYQSGGCKALTALLETSITDGLKSRLTQYLKHVVEDDVLFTNLNPLHTPPLLTKHHLWCSKIENYTNTHTTHLYFTDNFLCSLYLLSQSQQSLTKCNLFCFESPKLSLSFFNCSCSPMNVKMEQIGQVGPILGANVTLIEFFTR